MASNYSASRGSSVGAFFGGIARAITYFIVGTLLVVLLITATTATHVWGFARADDRQHADIIFVLGAAQYDGKPSKWLAARLDHAADLYKQGVAPKIVTVGYKKQGDRFTEADAGKNYLVNASGVPDSDVVALGTGVDTISSAEALHSEAQSRGWSSAVVVTDPSHSLRATSMVKDQGIDAWSSPTRQGPSVSSRAAQVNSILHETLGLMYYKTAQRENITFPEVTVS